MICFEGITVRDRERLAKEIPQKSAAVKSIIADLEGLTNVVKKPQKHETKHFGENYLINIIKLHVCCHNQATFC